MGDCVWDGWRHAVRPILLCPLILVVACQQTVPDGVHDESEALLAAWHDLGWSGSAIVRVGEDMQVADGFGECNRRDEVACGVDTAFDVGSITKQFTGAGIAALEEDGSLTAATTLGEIFGDIGDDKADITIEMLLTHTSGLTEQLRGDYRRTTRDELLALAWASDLRSEPGAEHRYSNLGYSVLAAVIEEVSGSPYESYMRDRIWAPAGMLHTGYVLPDWTEVDVAHGYRPGRRWGSPLERDWDDDGPWWNLKGNGGVVSTPADMNRWTIALRDGTVLAPETVERWQTGLVRECDRCSGLYAYGIVDTPGWGLKWHDGGNGVFYAVFLLWPETDTFIFTATNNWKQHEEAATWQLAELIQPQPE